MITRPLVVVSTVAAISLLANFLLFGLVMTLMNSQDPAEEEARLNSDVNITVSAAPGSSNTTEAHTSSNITELLSPWREQNPVVYGHIHMAKVAGTETNGELAAHYERVCGHKGYSYDSYADNERAREWKKQHPGGKLTPHTLQDSITKIRKRFSRGRVPFSVMQEIGFHDCDWISIEDEFGKWNGIASQIHPTPMELHVPCRDPIQYLLSMCNYQQYTFNCENAKEGSLKKEVNACLLYMERFQYNKAVEWINKGTGMNLKCYNPIPIEPYLEYMGQRLQPKRLVQPYIHRDTNKPRNKEKEKCLTEDEDLKSRVIHYLVNESFADVFKFCDACMGTENELKLSTTT